MKLSARVTTLSFFAATALGAATFAFAGCTVTSGTTTGDGGPPVNPGDGGGDAAAAVCEGNKQAIELVSKDCQACLNAKCCAELKGCFNKTVTPDDSGTSGTDDCNKFSECISFCYSKGQDQTCIDECAAAAGTGIPEAYQSVIDCTKAQGCDTACQLQNVPDPDGGADAATD